MTALQLCQRLSYYDSYTSNCMDIFLTEIGTSEVQVCEAHKVGLIYKIRNALDMLSEVMQPESLDSLD